MKNNLLSLFLFLFLAAAVVGCGGGNKELFDSGKTANAMISGTVSIKGETDCSEVVVIAEKLTDNVTSTVARALDGAKSGRVIDRATTADGVYVTTSATDCSFSLSVSPDTYSVSAHKEESLAAQPQKVTARSADVVTVNFELVATGKISGTAILGNSGSEVVIVFLSGTSFAAVADSGGAYTISNVPVGTYTIVFSRDGIMHASNDGALVAAGATTNDSLTSVNFACVMKSDCDDADQSTVDSCINARTPAAACENAVIPIEIKSLSSGGRHVCALITDGTVQCWGDNSRGQVGIGYVSGEGRWNGYRRLQKTSSGAARSGGEAREIDRESLNVIRFASSASYSETDIFVYEPVTVEGITDAIQVQAGDWVSCALISDGTVKCWGGNTDLELGNGTTAANSPTPTNVVGIDNAVSISVKNDNGCALIGDGTVRCWGANYDGELGNGTTVSSTRAVQASGITGAVAVEVGSWHGCALLQEGALKCWGSNWNGELGNPDTSANSLLPTYVPGITNAVKISAGGSITCALFADGTAKCLGANYNGQLGNGDTVDTHIPQTVSGLSGATSIEVGYSSSYALLPGGSALSWGNNYYEQLGNSQNLSQSNLNETTPVPVIDIPQSIIQIAPSARRDFVCLLLADHSVKCLGHGARGQLGDGRGEFSTTARQELGISDVVDYSIAGNHACAVLGDSTVTCWGTNSSYGFLGDGRDVGWRDPVTNAAGIVNAVKIAAGVNHVCALLSDGSAQCWGYNGDGQLGDGTNNNSMTPVAVTGLSGSVITDIVAGGSHTCALLQDQTVKCWGGNSYGQLGDGTILNSNIPVAVAGITTASAISTSLNHVCAIVSAGPTGGTAKCWGENSSGQLGAGAVGNQNAPVDPLDALNNSLSGVIAISAGWQHTCAVLYGGGVACWGSNLYGGLGDGTTNQTSVSTEVVGLSGAATDIVASNEYSCALISDGTVQCWGSNMEYTLGNNDLTGTSSPTPVTVIGLTGATDIEGGSSRACANTSANGLMCWGKDLYYYNY